MSGNVSALQYEWQCINAEEHSPSGTVSFTAIDKSLLFLGLLLSQQVAEE